MSDLAIPNDFAVNGQRFVIEAGGVLRTVGAAVGAGASLEAGGVVLAGAAVGIAAMPGPVVSREEAERIGAAERVHTAEIVAAAHGGPVALPTPSPFQNEAFVSRLPTAAMIASGITSMAPVPLPVDLTTAPHNIQPIPTAGTPSTLDLPSSGISTHVTPVHQEHSNHSITPNQPQVHDPFYDSAISPRFSKSGHVGAAKV